MAMERVAAKLAVVHKCTLVGRQATAGATVILELAQLADTKFDSMDLAGLNTVEVSN